MKKWVWIVLLLITAAFFFTARNFESRYERPINGDAKGYYAYLPALFIYQDAEYGFIDEIEQKYYPEDGSHRKDFRNKQRNGKYVNKCFPGLTVLYLPFFILSVVFSWLAGFPVDGYSLPFQMGIALAHLAYFYAGLWLLSRFLAGIGQSGKAVNFVFICLIFGTNCWFYIIYDHTVSHIFNFFLASLFMVSVQKWITTRNMKWAGFTGCLLALLIITRPTNALMILFIPLIFTLCKENFIPFILQNFNWKKSFLYIAATLLIFMIPPLLWKWQSDLWFVYSYNDEGFNFLSPNWLNFLFSYQKGWLLWTPLMFFFLITSTLVYFKKSVVNGLLFIAPLLLVTYVLSSWWCWTYGMGIGQRPMIDYYPFLVPGAVIFLNQVSYKNILFVALLPFIGLNMLQNYQVYKSILRGGSTTSEEYWSHFLQWKTNAPAVIIQKNRRLIDTRKISGPQLVNKTASFSQAIESDTLDEIKTIVVDLEIGARHGDPNISLVVSNTDGSIYKSFCFSDYLYKTPRKMAVQFDIPAIPDQVFKTYIWNGDTDSEATIPTMKVSYYK